MLAPTKVKNKSLMFISITIKLVKNNKWIKKNRWKINKWKKKKIENIKWNQNNHGKVNYEFHPLVFLICRKVYKNPSDGHASCVNYSREKIQTYQYFTNSWTDKKLLIGF